MRIARFKTVSNNTFLINVEHIVSIQGVGGRTLLHDVGGRETILREDVERNLSIWKKAYEQI